MMYLADLLYRLFPYQPASKEELAQIEREIELFDLRMLKKEQ